LRRLLRSPKGRILAKAYLSAMVALHTLPVPSPKPLPRGGVIKTAVGDVTLRQYARAWRAAKAMPVIATFRHSLTSLGSATRDEVLRQFSDGLHDRINRHIPGYGGGRKWSSDWQREMTYTARMLNTPRLVIDWLPADLRKRFLHRLRSSE